MTKSTFLPVDSEALIKTLREATAMIAAGNGELVLDFSDVERIDTRALTAMEELAKATHPKTPVVLRGVNVKVYKVLKLARLSSQFSFMN